MNRVLVAALVAPNARILSVLGSTSRVPASPSIEVMKRLISGEQETYYTTQMLGTAGVTMDAWLQAAALHHPGVTFIGTFPGVVSTDLVRTSKTFPSCLRPILAWCQKLVALSPVQCGRLHLQILASPNVGVGRVSYFNALRLEGRLTNPLAYDAEFRDFVWNFLEGVVAREAKKQA